jgi:hypothetical protein
MLIGSSGQFVTHMAPSECAARLSRRLGPRSVKGRADESRFELLRPGRTIIQMVGTFMPAGSGCSVDYRIELIPRAFIEVAIAFVVGTPILLVLVNLGYIAAREVASLIVIVLVVVAANIWFSDRQSQWLKAFVSRELEAGPG